MLLAESTSHDFYSNVSSAVSIRNMHPAGLTHIVSYHIPTSRQSTHVYARARVQSG